MFFKNDPSDKSTTPRRALPGLPLRDIIVFPHMVSQLFVGREKSIAALDEAMAQGKEIFLAAQKSAKTNDPSPEDVYAVGTIGMIVQLLRLADGTVRPTRTTDEAAPPSFGAPRALLPRVARPSPQT